MKKILLPELQLSTKSFELIKKILKKHEDYMHVLAEQTGVYYLAYPSAAIDNETQKVFAALYTTVRGTCLQLGALTSYVSFKDFIPAELVPNLDADHTKFVFHGDVESLISAIEMVIKLSIGII